jgi:hypothetical protein
MLWQPPASIKQVLCPSQFTVINKYLADTAFSCKCLATCYPPQLNGGNAGAEAKSGVQLSFLKSQYNPINNL